MTISIRISMTTLTESWIQDVAADVKIPAISPPVCRHILPVVEMQIRKIIQQAQKFQKRGKSRCLTVDDINLALSLNGLEEIYGLHPPLEPIGASSSGTPASSTSSSNIVNLLEYARQPIPKCPLVPELSLHWLAIDGYQPLIPENPLAATVSSFQPSSSSNSAADQPLLLSKEIQHFYYRTTGLILACDNATLPIILETLRSDMGLQELVPYYSKFVYSQIRANTRSLPILRALIGTLSALLTNKSLRMEFHLQQLLPAVFTCIVAARLSSTLAEDHWSLRSAAAQVVAAACSKYSELFPDLQARICKTYVDALVLSLSPSKGRDKDRDKDMEKQTTSLGTLYGGLVGLEALGHTVIRSLLLPRVQELLKRVDPEKGDRLGLLSTSRLQLINDRDHASEKCRGALLHALGIYMIARLRLPGSLQGVRREGSLGLSQDSKKRPRTPVEIMNPVIGLEEALVPFYATSSRELYYCRLLI